MKKSTIIAEFDQTVHLVDSSISSVFTKSDVIYLLRNLEGILKEYTSENEVNVNSNKNILTPEQISSLVEKIASEVSQMGENVISDYDLSLDYKEISLDGVDLHYDNIYEKVEESINDWITDMDDNNDDDCDC